LTSTSRHGHFRIAFPVPATDPHYCRSDTAVPASKLATPAYRGGARRLGIILVYALALTGCDQLLSPGAIHWKTLHVDEAVTDHVRAGEPVQYRMDAPSGQPVRVFFEAQGDSLLLELVDASADSARLLAHIVSSGSDTSLTGQASPWFQLDGGRDVQAHVRTLGTSGGGSYNILLYGLDTAPETGSAVVALGDTVSEAIDPPGDIDEFRVHVDTTSHIIAFLQTFNYSDLALSVRDSATGTSVAHAVSYGAVSHLESRSSGLLSMPAGTYIASVGAERGTDERGDYRFQLRPISMQPERVPGVVQPGDTVTGEWIRPLGDVDEYRLSLAQTHDINIFFWRPTGSGPQFELQLLQGDSAVGPPLRAMWPSPPDSIQTGRLHLDPGNYTIRVSGLVQGDPATATGEYGFEVRDIDPAPETLPAQFAVGDTVAGEKIDGPGDYDDFTFSTSATGAYMVFFRRIGQSTDTLRLRLLDAAGDSLLGMTITGPQTALDEHRWGRFTLDPGTYTVRVEGSGEGAEYGFQVYGVDVAPESASAQITPGDTVYESLDEFGDIDEFTFPANRFDYANVVLTSLSSNSLADFRLQLELPDSQDTTTVLAPPLATAASGWTFMPDSGTRTVRILEPENGSARGPYRVLVQQYHPDPESVPSVLAAGDSVTGESIDSVGDVDLFTFQADSALHQEVTLSGWAASGAVGYIEFTMLAPDGSEVAQMDYGTGTSSIVWRQPLDRSGEWAVRVRAAPYNTYSHGPYGFSFMPIDRAPENTSPAIAIGDSVAGESLSPIGDVDEFAFDAVAGDSLRLDFTSAATSYDVRVLDDVTGGVVADTASSAYDGTQVQLPFIIPATGRYRLVFDTTQGYRHDGDQGPYTFVLGRM
jgi:hypothetical protein